MQIFELSSCVFRKSMMFFKVDSLGELFGAEGRERAQNMAVRGRESLRSLTCAHIIPFGLLSQHVGACSVRLAGVSLNLTSATPSDILPSSPPTTHHTMAPAHVSPVRASPSYVKRDAEKR